MKDLHLLSLDCVHLVNSLMVLRQAGPLLVPIAGQALPEVFSSGEMFSVCMTWGEETKAGNS